MGFHDQPAVAHPAHDLDGVSPKQGPPGEADLDPALPDGDLWGEHAYRPLFLLDGGPCHALLQEVSEGRGDLPAAVLDVPERAHPNRVLGEEGGEGVGVRGVPRAGERLDLPVDGLFILRGYRDLLYGGVPSGYCAGRPVDIKSVTAKV